MRRSSLFAIVFLTICFITHCEHVMSSGGVAATRGQAKRPAVDLLTEVQWHSEESGPLCGVYAACSALKLVGLQADPRDFLAAKYVGGCGGSSPEEVARVLEESGAHATILSHLSSFDLRIIDCPLIANVRKSPASKRFDHWVVALPDDNGVSIIDGTQEPYTITTAEFLGQWSGIGIAVNSTRASPLASIRLARLGLFLSIVTALVLLPDRFVWLVRESAGVFSQGCALAGASVVLAIAGGIVFGDLPNHSRGVAVATAPSRFGAFRSGSIDAIKQSAARHEILLVDARELRTTGWAQSKAQ